MLNICIQEAFPGDHTENGLEKSKGPFRETLRRMSNLGDRGSLEEGNSRRVERRSDMRCKPKYVVLTTETAEEFSDTFRVWVCYIIILTPLKNTKTLCNDTQGDDGIPVELFQILKDDAVKVLHSICQQIWKTQQWPQDWKRSVFIPTPKKSNAKECSNYCTIALISHASKVMLKILHDRLQQYVNCELPDVQAVFRKGRGTRDQIANIHWEKERGVPEKHLFLLY